MYYNKNKLKMVPYNLAQEFGIQLEKSNYKFLYNSLIGMTVCIDFWPNEKQSEKLLKRVHKNDADLVRFLLMGYSIEEYVIRDVLGESGKRFLLESNFAIENNGKLNSNGYAVLPVNDMFLIVSIPSIYSMNKHIFPDIYIGQDSTRLYQMISNKEFDNVLDLCAGSGIQGFALARHAKQIRAVELNEIANIAVRLNQAINNIPKERFCVYQESLYKPFDGGEKFDCIICNPPYVPCPENINLPMCGAGGEDGMKYARQVIDGYDGFLVENGYAYMVLECIGNTDKPYIIDYFQKKFSKGVLNVSIINKQPVDYQIDYSAQLAYSVDQNGLSLEEYQEIWRNLFKKQNASNMYSLVIEYKKTDVPFMFNIISNCSQWDIDSIYSLSPCSFDEIEIPYYRIKTDLGIRFVEKEYYDLLIKYDGKKVDELLTALKDRKIQGDGLLRFDSLEKEHLIRRVL